MDKKALKTLYKNFKTKMGIYKVWTQDGKMWIGSAKNLPGIINSLKFQLELGTHRNKELQAIWKERGADAFKIEILDELEYDKENPDKDYADDLKALLEMWKEKLNCGAV
jgi:hypothetical protein